MKRNGKSLLVKLQMSVLIEEIANLESRDATLRKDVVPLSLECKNKQETIETVKLVAKSISFRKTVIEKEKVISELKEAMIKLENDL